MNRTALVIALVLVSGCSLPFAAPTGAYRNQGVAHYVGRPLLGTPGEFDQFTVSPDGKQAVFAGRESNVAYELFIADIDGPIRKLVATGQSPGYFAWSADGKRLLYRALDVFQPGQPVAVSDVPTGEALHIVTVADGADLRLTEVAGRGMAYPSPTLSAIAIYDGALGLRLLDPETGSQTPLQGDYGRDRPTLVWLPDGSGFFMVEPGARPDQGRLVRYLAPAWTPEPLGPIVTYPGQPAMTPDGRTLRFFLPEPYSPERDYRLRMRSFTDGVEQPEVTVALGRPPSGYDFDWSGKSLLVSPDGERALLHRRTYSTGPLGDVGVQPTPDPNLPPPASFIFDVAAATLTPIAADARPHAWLDAGRVLAYTGQGQDKVLTIFTP